MVKGVFDELAAAPQEPLHRRHRRRRHLHQPALRRATSTSRTPRRRAGRLLGARLGRDGRRQQEPSRSSARRPRHLRPGLLRLRLEEVGRADHLAPALRPAPDRGAVPDPPRRASSAATSSASSSKVDVLGGPRRARPVLLNSPVRARARSGTTCPRPVQQQVIDKELRLWAIDADAVAEARGLAGRDQHRHADLLLRDLRRAPADEAIDAIKERDPEDLRQAGREVVRRTRPPSTPPWPTCTRCPCPSAPTGGPRAAVDRSGRRPGLRPHRDRGDDGRPRRRPAGQCAPGGRHLPERHDGLREAPDLRRGRRLGPGQLHPVRQLRVRLPAQRDPLQVLRAGAPRGGARTASSRPRSTRPVCRAPGTPCRSTSRTAPAAASASRPAR